MRLKKDGLDEAGTRVAKVTRRTLAKVGIAAGCGSMAASIPLIGDWTSLPNESTFPKQMTNKPRGIVVGAGAFGGWTALHLLRGGASVTLIDTWGPGNSRSSSGGETRVIRGAYGPGQPYTRMAARSFELWREQERQWNEKLLHSIGVLWMAEDDGAGADGRPVVEVHPEPAAAARAAAG